MAGELQTEAVQQLTDAVGRITHPNGPPTTQMPGAAPIPSAANRRLLQADTPPPLITPAPEHPTLPPPTLPPPPPSTPVPTAAPGLTPTPMNPIQALAAELKAIQADEPSGWQPLVNNIQTSTDDDIAAAPMNQIGAIVSSWNLPSDANTIMQQAAEVQSLQYASFTAPLPNADSSIMLDEWIGVAWNNASSGLTTVKYYHVRVATLF
jgi:hypothetical protein